MADTNEMFSKGDVMTALAKDMQQMVEDKKKMMDPNHKDDDTDSEENSSDEETGSDNFFTSAIDVGSHFIDVNPGNELVFQGFEGNLMAQFQIANPCKNANIAFFVYTSAPIPVKIVPNCGFIPASYSRNIKIAWEKDQMPDTLRLENSMFFVKALPLSAKMDTEELG